MAKGKGRRRRMANYLSAHGGDSNLPPSPATREINAVPSKLRRIMTLKLSVQKTCELNSNTHKSENRAQNEIKVSDVSQISDMGKCSTVRGINNKDESSIQPSGEAVSQKKKKRKRKENLHFLMDKLKATSVHKGLNERKKRYLEEKKKKKRNLGHSRSSFVEFNQVTHQQETIRFGDVVDAPPKLSFPKKDTTIWEERMRQEAIESYRQKKKWLSRPGSHRPPSLAQPSIFNS